MMSGIEEIIEAYDYCPRTEDCVCDACPYYDKRYGIEYPHCYRSLTDDAIDYLRETLEAKQSVSESLDRMIDVMKDLLEKTEPPKEET